MKRYLLFVWWDGPRGGWNDFFSSFASVENALGTVGERDPHGWQIVDSNIWKVVAGS